MRPPRRASGSVICALVHLTAVTSVTSVTAMTLAPRAQATPLAMLRAVYVGDATLTFPSLAGSGTSSSRLTADLSLRNGTLFGSLTMKPISGIALVYGFAPSPFIVEISQAAPVSGTVGLVPPAAAGPVDAELNADISLKLSLLGVLPINGGKDCRTATPVKAHLATPKGNSFDAFEGGEIVSGFQLSPFQNCGRFGALLNSLVVTPGAKNSLHVRLRPSADAR